MSSPSPTARQPFVIEVVDRADRLLREEMAQAAGAAGYPEIRPAHNAVFAHLRDRPRRVSELAAVAGMTKQSMGELVRDLVAADILEATPDPSDRRAKLVWYTDRGIAAAGAGFQHLQDVEQQLREALGEERLAEMLAALTEVADVVRANTARP